MKAPYSLPLLMRPAGFLVHPLAVLLLVLPAAANAGCRVRFLPGNSMGAPAGRIEVAHGRNDDPGVKFFLVSRGGIAPFADVAVLEDALTVEISRNPAPAGDGAQHPVALPRRTTTTCHEANAKG